MSGNLTATNGIGSTPAQRHYISASQASAIVSAAEKAAASIVPQNIAVVDPSGLLVAFLRMDNAYPGSIDISIKKARTSVLFNGIPSGALLNQSLEFKYALFVACDFTLVLILVCGFGHLF
ncbi:hypothetical protein D6D08_08069 [Aureobasidium pullulans]|nr:hypothetical protein D6D08_08069 [Aureobasidium pullulans]